MKRALLILLFVSGCKSSSEGLLGSGLPLRCFEGGPENQCRGHWVCGHEGVCFDPSVPARRLCANDDECSGWHCGVPNSDSLGRCYPLEDAGAVGCRADGGPASPDCAPEWRCGLDAICFDPTVPLERACLSDEYCADGYRCSVTSPRHCVPALAEALPQRTAPSLALEFLTPTLVPERAPFKFSFSSQTSGFAFVSDGGVFIVENDILNSRPGTHVRVRGYPALGDVRAVSLTSAPPDFSRDFPWDLAIVGDQAVPLGGRPTRAPFPLPVPGARRVHQVPLDFNNSFAPYRFVVFSGSDLAWLSETGVLPMHPPSGTTVSDVTFDYGTAGVNTVGHVILATNRGLYGARFPDVVAADGGAVPWLALRAGGATGLSHPDCDGGVVSPVRWVGIKRGSFAHQLALEVERDGGTVVQEYFVDSDLPTSACDSSFLSIGSFNDEQGCDAGTASDWLNFADGPVLQCSNTSGVQRAIETRFNQPIDFAIAPLEPDRNNFHTNQGGGGVLLSAYLDEAGGVTVWPNVGLVTDGPFRPFLTSRPALLSGDADAGFALIDFEHRQYGPPFDVGASFTGRNGDYVCADFEGDPTRAVAAAFDALAIVPHSSVLAQLPPPEPASRPTTLALLDNSADLVRAEDRVYSDQFGSQQTGRFPFCAPSAQGRVHAFTLRDRDGVDISVVSAFDRIWAGPLSTSSDAGVERLRVVASPAPFTGIDSLTIAAPSAASANVLEGYLLASGRLFQLTAVTDLRWRTTEVLLSGAGDALDVWNDGSRFRISTTSGVTYSLPAFVAISPPAPEPVQRVVGFCGNGYALGAGSLYRLEPTPGNAVGTWTPVPLPSRRLVRDPSRRFAGGLLHIGRGELHVADDVGNIVILRVAGCE